MSETTKMRCRYTDEELRGWALNYGGQPSSFGELLAYRERYGDIDAPPKSPQPVAGDCVWLGDCEPSERAKLLEDIAALRAEVERRDEIIACEVELRKHAGTDANHLYCDLEKAQAEAATAKAEAARYRAAIVGALMKHDVPPSVRILIDALMPNEEVF